MSGEGMCWCASDTKCPHGISHKIPTVWEDLEKIIDDVLQNFDRKSIRRFLKKTADGNSNIAKQSKDAYKTPEDVKFMLEKAKHSEPAISSSPELIGKKRRSDAIEGESMLSRTTPLAPSDGTRLQPLKRPATVSGDHNVRDGHMEKSLSVPALSKSSVAPLPKIQPSNGAATGFSRDLMSQSLPKLPPRQNLQTKTAWGTGSVAEQTQGSPISSPTTKHYESFDNEQTNNSKSQNQNQSLQKTNPLYPMQADSIITAGLMRIVDQLARILLPWQAVLCPRAVETLQDLRLSLIQSKHALFMQQMKSKLEDKVTAFMRKKEDEVDTWLEKEIKSWQQFLSNDEIDLTDFIKADLDRLTQRSIAQDQAYRQRELQIANDLDDHERDQTREQLINFRRIVRASKNPLPGGSSMFDQEPKHVEVRVLQDTIAKAQTSMKTKAVDTTRTTIRKIEESHDWLSSLADNALTAAISEERLKHLYSRLDKEKTKSMDSLHTALANYKEQHNSILEAITVFAGRIHQHATDYLQREQLVTRAFLQYLLAIISGEIKSHTGEQKKNSYAWETKSLSDRQLRKEQSLISEFHHHINPLDKMVAEFKEKMRIQLEHITMKLQSIVNGKENDINARKALIHRKLAKHVNKACNARRQRLKNATAIRRDEFELESLAMTKVQELCGDLRSSIDSIWVKEHLKERKIYEAAMGRLERLEKSALIIWNKHSHLAIDTKEDYSDWLENYKKDRDLKIMNHKLEIERNYLSWRDDIGVDMRQLSSQIRLSFKTLVPKSLVYDINDPLEKNITDLRELYDHDNREILSIFAYMKDKLEQFIKSELSAIDAFNQNKKQELLYEYQSQLIRLDSAINRRIGGLKDMEADLEETIRLTIMQHEVENNVFEQLSCSRYEKFWIDWASRIQSLSRELTHTQEDYEVSKRNGKVKSRIPKKDRMIDDLVDVAKENAIATGNNTGANKLKSTAEALNNMAQQPIYSNPDEPVNDPSLDPELTDTLRIKYILDDIKPELFRDFQHKLTRQVEKIRRDLGEGRKQYCPLFAIAKVIAIQCDRFYEKTRLNERCVGRISSQGVLLYQEGLPVHAKHKFILGTTLSMLAILPIKEYKIDCEDLFAQLENMKVYFMIGLLTIIDQYHEFGEYFIRSECLWMCSVLEIAPPEELLISNSAKGLKESIPESFEPNGIFSEDTVDIYNRLIQLPTDLETVDLLTKKYQEKLLRQRQQQKAYTQSSNNYYYNDDLNSLAGVESQLSSSINEENDPSGLYNYNKQPQQILDDISSFRQMQDTLQRLQGLLPMRDCVIFSALLGRPDGSMDYTTHRICQVVSIWRRVSVAMTTVTLQPPSTEYPRIQELISSHNASITGRKRVETSNIHCISPFEAVSSGIDYLTSIQGLPISILQALSLLSKGGNVDLWLEDPKQSFRHERMIDEIKDLIDLYHYRIPKSMIHNEYLQLTLPKSIHQILESLDLNYSNQLPIEALRTFLQRDDLNLTNNQISMIFWALCRQNEEVDGDTQSVNGSATGGKVVSSSEGMKTFQTGGGFRPLVATQFYGDPEKYMIRFGEDVDKYLHSMPSIDSNVVIGYITNPLTNTAAHELVSDAMKLDAAARNPMPATCCIWLSSRIIHREDALKALILPGALSNEGNYLLGVTHHAFSLGQLPSTEVTDGENKAVKDVNYGFLLKLRAFVEVDILAKYPEISEIRASDRHYGPAGNDPMVHKPSLSEDFHWKELLTRRLQRLDRLTKSWRETMLSEWAESLYISRKMRYAQRINLIQKSVSVYHTQYHDLREAILQERSGLISLYRGLDNELITLIQDDYSLITYHTSFLDRMLRRFEGEYERFWFIVKEMMLKYVHHISSIRRYGIEKINLASDRLRSDLDASCNGLIAGYTTGYAQGYFDELILRGEIWRKKLTDLQGKLIIIKEHFMFQKDEIDRDLTIQITDRLTMNRQQTKSHLQSLNEDSTTMLEAVANTRTSYAALQKDANARLILRIEKAIRESRKLRNAAEQQPEIEEAVLRDIRTVLIQSKQACLKIVDQIRETCLKQLHSLNPVRSTHREKMEKKVEHLKQLWKDVEVVVFPLIDDYEKEITKQLQIMNAKAIEMINIYNEEESSSIKRKYQSERVLLIQSFRKHFREYDLNELTIFERFNTEVNTIVQDMIRLWGPSRPKFIANGLKELKTITAESLNSSYRDIRQSSLMRSEISDVIILSRMELADLYHFHLSKSYDYVTQLPRRFLEEKEETLEYIDEMSLEKNGDMVRPQVKAVMDLLISGIEIDYDFNLGYENLINATKAKTGESFSELSDFLTRYQSMDYPVSIPQTIDLTKQKIQARKDEVNALLDASNAHMVADHSKLDVLFSAGEKDIDEWSNLTLQLIENAYHNAELNYLSNLWPTPEPTPRLDEVMIIGEDEDRVGKLKTMIAQTSALTAEMRERGEGTMVPYRATGYDIAVNNSISTNNMANYTGDMKLLLQHLALSPEEEEEERRLLEEKKAEKLRRAEEARLAALRAKEEEDAKSQISDLGSVTSKNDFKEMKTIELQQGWFECHSPEGYIYYHNPVTQESLWDLPQFLKKRKHDDYDDGAKKKLENEPEKLIDTPRELLVMEGHLYPNETIPIRVVPETFKLDMKIDRKMVMSEVTEEARAISLLAVNTAVDITNVIHGRKGRDEQTIATLLGDRYDPETLKKYQKLEEAAESGKSDLLDRLLAKHIGEEDAEKKEYEQFLKQETLLITSLEAEKQTHIQEARQTLLNEKGFMIADEENPEQMIEKTNAEVEELLLNLGLGSALESSQIDADEDDRKSPNLAEIVQPEDWLQLGLGEKTRGDNETDSSDGEDYTGFNQKNSRLQSIEELKYLQTKELELMGREDKHSIAYENLIENENCQLFLDRLSIIKSMNAATAEDKEYLQALSSKIRLINVIEIFQEVSLSWEEIDQLIERTIARREREKELEEEMKTKEGLQRQQYILEHNDDIQELMKFFVEQCHLSKLLSKKMATELILRQIATSKKLAKIWSRGEINLQEEFQLDEDDNEELEKALYSLIQPTATFNPNASTQELLLSPNQSMMLPGHTTPATPMNLMSPAMMMMGTNGTAAAYPMMMVTPFGNMMMMADPNNNPFAASFAFNNGSSSFLQSPTANMTKSVTSLPPDFETPVKAEKSVQSLPKEAEMTRLNSNFNLDPSWITQVSEDEAEEKNELEDEEGRKEVTTVEESRLSKSSSKRLEYKMTKDGYKSFRGGWIEGVSDSNEVYYYNVKTGQSAWNLPDLLAEGKEGEENESVNKAAEEEELLSVAFADRYEEDLKAGRISPEQGSVYSVPQVAATGSVSNQPQIAGDLGYDVNDSGYNDYQQPHYSPHESYQALPRITGSTELVPFTNSTTDYNALPSEQHDYYDPNDPNAYYYNQDPNATYSYHEQNLYSNYPYDPNYQQYDPNDQQVTSYDPYYNNGDQQYYDSNYYYDPNTYYQDQPGDNNTDNYSVGSAPRPLQSNEVHPYYTDGKWKMSDALGVEHIADYIPPPKPRAIPTYQTLEVIAYAKKEGTNRQMTLLQTQDRWQNALVKTQHVITEQKTKFLNKRQEMFDKVSKRVDNRLNAFVEDIKFMQKTLKKELGDANATERDLRRLFDENQQNQMLSSSNHPQNHQQSFASLQSQDILRAEKLSFILESLEKFKLSVSEKYESSFKQINKFASDWELIKMELLQIGDIFDEGIISNLEQCKLSCEHQAKLFVYEQIKQTSHLSKGEIQLFRKGLKKELWLDQRDAEITRDLKRQEQLDYCYHREVQREQLRRVYGDSGIDRSFLERELVNQGLPPIDKEEDLLTEEELVMSFLLTQIEMEASLQTDYESILDASKNMAIELQAAIKEFDIAEKKNIKEDGSWFNKHRETLERHEQALHITLNKVRNRINEGYQILQSRIEALDFDVEKAAEEELYQGSIDNHSTHSSL